MAPLESSDARMHSFIVNHAEHAAGRGLMPYVRVVGYETPAQ
jgi:sigma-E factor negative regulatory protein RseA